MWGLMLLLKTHLKTNNILQVSNVNDDTRHNLSDEVSELSVPETRFDRQTHSHHMLTGQTDQTNQVPEFLTGRISIPRNPPSHQHQNLSTQVSQDNNLYQWLNKHQEIKTQTQTIPLSV